MIKVGQIYNVPYLGGKLIVTWIRADKTNFDVVRNDGFFFICSEPDYKWKAHRRISNLARSCKQ